MVSEISNPHEQKRLASGRTVSLVEGFVQTIGINIGGIFIPNFILTAFLLNVMHASSLLIGFATSVLFFVNLMQPFSNIIARKVKSRKILVAITSFMGRGLFISAIFFG